MDVTPRRLSAGALGLLVLGALLVGWGIHADRTDPCQSGSRLVVDRLAVNASPESVVAYENLSTREQRLFAAAVSNGSSPIDSSADASDRFSGEVVEYRAERYTVGVETWSCGEPGLRRLFAGTGAAAVGGLLLVLAAGWWGIRRRS